MKQPILYKKLSKYIVSTSILEFKILNHKEVIDILKQRQYVEKEDFWENGFVRIFLFRDYIQIEHSIIKKNEKSKGVKCYYEEKILKEFLRYFEYKFKR